MNGVVILVAVVVDGIALVAKCRGGPDTTPVYFDSRLPGLNVGRYPVVLVDAKALLDEVLQEPATSEVVN